MAEQSLDSDEQLNVRWAYDDPNPVAIKRVKVEKNVEAYNAILDKGICMYVCTYVCMYVTNIRI